jgi:hypothetical protein
MPSAPHKERNNKPMTNEEAIHAIKCNYPHESYTMLREALDIAMALLAAESKPMIPWIKYDEYDRGIESHVTHLVISEDGPQLAQHAKLIDRPGYGWHRFGGNRVYSVTHWSPINLPGEETSNANTNPPST